MKTTEQRVLRARVKLRSPVVGHFRGPLLQSDRKSLLYRPPLKPDESIDYGRVAFGLAMELAKSRHSRDCIKEALREGSPGPAGRKAQRLEDYLDRTVDRAMDALTKSRHLEQRHGPSWGLLTTRGSLRPAAGHRVV